MHQLETLASKRSRASQFTRTLKIANLAPFRRDLTIHVRSIHVRCHCRRQTLVWKPSADYGEIEAGMRKHLVPAISLLKNVENVM
jgi:hypothetical protein